MALAEISTRAGIQPWPTPEAGPTVLSIVGEQDVSNQSELAADLARAIAEGDSDLVLDLRDVAFMGASTIGMIVSTNVFLAARDRNLVVRAPSGCARRLLDICGLIGLIEGPTLVAVPSRSP
jgi:anti-anti-sigma factor